MENEDKVPGFLKKVSSPAIPLSGELALPAHVFAILLVFITLALWMILPNDITKLIFIVSVLGTTLLSLLLAVKGYKDTERELWNFLPFFVGTGLLLALMQTGGLLLSILFSFYLIIALFFSGKIIRLQTALIIILALTAIFFRVYPMLPGSGTAPGHLISMDDPYYHYKQTEKLYNLGDIPDVDYSIYPPEGRAAPHKFPYYYNTYLAHLTLSPIRDATLLYPVLISAFGAVMMYFLLKELTGDWKSGFLGGLFFATMPAILAKSAAGAIEEDLMGMVLGIFSLYLLAKAMKSAGRENLKYSVLSGLSFFLTLISWKGVIFLYAIPFTAMAIYFMVIFAFLAYTKFLSKKELSDENKGVLWFNTWQPLKAVAIAGIIPIIGNLIFLTRGQIDLTQLAPYGAVLFWGILAEAIRFKYFGNENEADYKRKYLMKVTGAFIVLALVFLLWVGVDRIATIPSRALEGFAGTTGHNFLVDKTISEQAAFARGSIIENLMNPVTYARYGIAEPLTVVMSFLLLLPLIYYLKKNAASFFLNFRAYLIALTFFAIAIGFVWVEARLAFSQSLGFLLLGAMTGLLLPKNLKELMSIRMAVFLIVLLMIPLALFTPVISTSAWTISQRPSSLDPAWFNGVKWLDENIVGGEYVGGEYVNGDYVLTWWDYGHFITALSDSTVIADPLQAGEEYIMRIARFFYNTTSEAEAMNWLKEQPWNPTGSDGEHKVRYIILDFSLVGKAGALTFLGTNEYEYPNGATAVDGVCERGVVCQNVKTGELAKREGDSYVCDSGEVCTSDRLTNINPKKCCVAEPTQCCDTSFNWRVIRDKNGSPRLHRSPGSGVYGQYQLNREGAACRPEFSTNTKTQVFVEGGERKTVLQTLLYTGYSGLRYADGGDYPAFVVFTYADGTQKMRFISTNCETKPYEEVMSAGDDQLVDVGYRVRLNDEVAAPQIFVHVPERWKDSMFAKLYLNNAQDLDHFEIILDEETQGIFPSVKIFKVNYPEGELTEPTGAQNGDRVYVDYTGKFENGTVFDTSIGKSPLSFEIGSGQMISGFDAAIEGMEEGESKQVTILPEDAYGVSGNHPLANKTLVFEITLLSIGEAPETKEPADSGDDELKFDYFDNGLAQQYGIEKAPTLIWNCQFASVGTYSTEELMKLACVMNRARPTELCSSIGVTLNEENKKISGVGLTNLLKGVSKLRGDSCKPSENSSLIQAFHTKDCSECVSQRPSLEQIDSSFGNAYGVDYYCVGEATYCESRSDVTVA